MTARVKIESKIVGYRVEQNQPGGETPPSAPAAETHSVASDPVSDGATVVRMHEGLRRPEHLHGTTYKIKTPVSDHAMYVTINDIILNEGTPNERRRPFEIFINSKNLEQYQWIVALTRVMSAVFRKGGEVAFLVDELQAVFDPRGGYWQPGGIYMPSIIAELGGVIGEHLKQIGFIDPNKPDPEQQAMLDAKRLAYEDGNRQTDAFARGGFPKGAQLCGKCHTTAVVMTEGCLTCLNCGDSKCG